ncbi:uncharacterized protein LOC108907075 [Anoplophora glabripennis]|uniref:uncharacterized protein LOC108907075 n=1 Tax=Anoplophora glabripennis TaxID=217634 RepID=UPI000873A623|nr:uncharacterized protein LOC108907075 [Anoplophora glabripennis]
MLPVKFFLVLSLQILAVFGLGNNVLINLPELDENQLKWPQQKIQTIEYLLDTLMEVGNVTLIGWQKIWNSDGTLKEIRTIELTLLNHTLQTNSGDILKLSDEDMIDELPVVLDVMDTISSATGILVSGSIQQLDRHENVQLSLKMDPNSIMINLLGSDLMYWQQNITVTSQTPIQNLIKTLQQQSRLPVGVLHWNVDGTLNIQSSVIVPELLATIESVIPENASLPLLESALKGVAKGVLLQPDEVPTYVAHHMKQNIPGYTWVVATDLDTPLVTPGVYLNVVYEWVDIGKIPISVDIMGIPIHAL